VGLEAAWYKRSVWLVLLRPLERLFSFLVKRRRKQYQDGEKTVWTAPVPVIIVGNISVGGTGKSPLVIWLIDWLRQLGYKPGVVSRGYKAQPPCRPFFVTASSSVAEVGDEPLMIVRRTAVPMVIDPDRVAATKLLLEHTDCDLVISDDGLQHYALGRTIEIAVVDGKRGFGNGRCLPEGPLREPVSRLDEVDLVVFNGEPKSSLVTHNIHKKCSAMQIRVTGLQSLSPNSDRDTEGRFIEIGKWQSERTVHAVAGIGNPQRFYTSLSEAGFTLQQHSFPDHHQFKVDELQFDDGLALIMTEKDAVKCDHMQLNNAWYLQVSAELEQGFELQLRNKLKRSSSK